MTDIRKALEALLGVADTICELVKAKGSLGMPSGDLYAILMGYMSLEAYQKLMSAIVQAGRLRYNYHCYWWIDLTANNRILNKPKTKLPPISIDEIL